MDSKQEILNKIRSAVIERYEMPDLEFIPVTYDDPVSQFSDTVVSVGGIVCQSTSSEDINLIIKELYPDVKRIASNLDEITVATLNPDSVDGPHALQGTDLAVIRGELGVAENGCVWIPQQTREKVLYFIAEYLVILLKKENIVHTMHAAYEHISFNDYGFGVFISGPSKTADIEQSLVVGAHGAKGVTVILTD